MNKKGKKIVYDKDFDKIKFLSNYNNLSLGKLISNFPTLTVLIRCVIEKEEIFYP